jgi:transcriptional regulator with XRE-family HTH domain
MTVKQICKALNISQKELANILGVNEQTPAQWEHRGKIPKWVENFVKCLLEKKVLEDKIKKLQEAKQAFLEL